MTLKTVSFLCLLILFKPTLASSQSSFIGVELFGKASYYENKFYGRKTASGEILKKNVLTCAHPTLPFGTMIEVTNLTNNKWCIVRVNDRGPFAKGRLLDLSHVAAKQLDMFRHGIAKVKVTVVGENDTIYIERPDSMIKSASDLIVDEPEEEEVQVPLKPKPKTIRTKASKSLKKKRASRRKKGTSIARSKSKKTLAKKGTKSKTSKKPSTAK
ncbi:septal ring lytic transglycosylase RlpA family protein [Emticicia sp. C21]|uniref:septal ring lytic transglycosylase RlpA family protein n=1 Tax=Emticicia sp. C21 TaxID=2302915 RepID=UPI000E346DB4|nr:septal ring lytic transglycosylase RlpA family protein [Emticicia sp. C21]RFS14195.1 septal ring lytic transglycosylase RlpA family protein [Emticicia sp. C21]